MKEFFKILIEQNKTIITQNKTLAEQNKALQQEIANFLGDMGKRLIKHIKESKESDEKITEQGEKILEVLDDMGKGIATYGNGILDNNNDWGASILEGLGKLGIGISSLGKKIDNAETSIKTNSDFTYKAVKELDNTIHRKSW